MRRTRGWQAFVGIGIVLMSACDGSRDPDASVDGSVLPDGATPDASVPLPSNVTRVHEPREFLAGPTSFSDGRIVDGRLVARAIVAADESPHVAVFDPASGAVRDVSGATASLLWHSRRSPLAVYVADGGLYAFEGVEGTPRKISGDEIVTNAWVADDEQRVLYAAAPAEGAARALYIVGIDGSRRHALSTPADRWFVAPGSSNSRVTRPRLAPDGRRVAFLAATQAFDGSDIFYDGPLELHTIALDPDGAPLGTSSAVAAVADSRISEGAFQFEFSSDGTRLVFATRTGGMTRLFTTAFDGSPPAPIGAEWPIQEVVMSPDRAHVVWSVGNVFGGGVQRANPDGTGVAPIVDAPVRFIAVSLDSRFVYYDGRDGRLRAVPIVGGQPVEVQPPATERDRLFALLDDGRALFTVTERTPAPAIALVLADPATGSLPVLWRDPIDPRESFARNSLVGVVAGRALYASTRGTPPMTTVHAIALDGSGSVDLALPSPHGQPIAPELVAASDDRAFLSFDGTRWTFEELHAFDLASGAIENLTARGRPLNYADVYSFDVGASGRTIVAGLDHHFSTAALFVVDRVTRTECTIETPIEPRFSIIDVDPSRDESAVAFNYAPNGPWTAYRASTSHCTAVALNTLLPPDPAVRRLRISPDSQWTVVEGNQLWAIRAGTNEVVALTNLAPGTRIRSSNGGGFAISPDSQRVAYLVENTATGLVELYSVRIDGTETVRLNPPLPPGATVYSSGFCPAIAFTPDSRSVVYTIVVRDRLGALHRTRIDGTDPIRLSGAEAVNIDDVYGCRAITIAPDGSRVVYAAQREAGTHGLYAVGIDGGAIVELAQGAGTVGASGLYLVVPPIVTSDSRTVVYAENGSVWAVGIDGSQRRRLSETRYAYRTTLTRDGSRALFFGSSDLERYSLFSAPLDGSGAQDLTPSEQVTDPGDAIATTADGLVVFLGTRSRPLAVPAVGGAVIPLLPDDPRRMVRAIGTSPAGDTIYLQADLARRGVIELFEVRVPR